MENSQKEQSIQFSEELLATQDEASLSDRYRSFLFMGFGRVLVSRIMSLIYIILVTRFVARIVQDQMIFLTTGQFMIMVITTFGFSFSLIRQAIASPDRAHVVSSASTISFVIGLPLTLILNFTFALFVPLSIADISFYCIASGLYFILQLVYLVEDARLRSDRTLMTQTIYQVVNSLLIPSLFIIFQSISGVLLAWIAASIIALCWEIKTVSLFLRSITWDFTASWKLFTFGLPIYLSTIFATLVQRVDIIILYVLFPVGDVSEFYWVKRIVEMIVGFFLTFLIGAFPLLTKMKARGIDDTYKNRIKSIFRLALLIGLIFYGFAFIQAYTIIVLILSPDFFGGVLIMKVLIIGFFIRISTNVLYAIFSAEGKRRFMVEGSITGNLFRIVLLLILASYGGIGMAWILVLHNIYLVLYNSYRSRALVRDSILEVRYLVPMILIGLFCLLVPDTTNIVNAIIVGIIYLCLIFIILLIFRPLAENDVLTIERILGRRFSYITPVIRFFSH